MRSHIMLFVMAFLCAGLCAGENLVNTYRLDSNSESYRLTLKENWSFELTGPGNQQANGTYVASDRKVGLLAGNLLRHFEYQVQNGDLLLRPSTTDGPEANNVLGQMPPTQRGDAFTAYLTEAHYQQKYAAAPAVQTPAVQAPAAQPVATGVLTMDQLLAQATTDSQYHAYMAAGTKALGERKFAEARAHFILANRFKPNSVEAREQIALADGAAAMAEGDVARQKGDLRNARQAYERAKQACPALTAMADAQLGTMRVFQQPGVNRNPRWQRGGGTQDGTIAQQVQAGRTADALQEAMTALQADPTSLRLRSLKEGLEGLQTAEGLYQNLNQILGRAQTYCDTVGKDEPLDGQTAQWKAQFAAQAQQVDARLAAARNSVAGNLYGGLGNTLTDARATANETAGLLDKARATYAAKAAELAKDNQVDLPFVTIKLDKENKRVGRLNGYADGFKSLSAEAAALAR